MIKLLQLFQPFLRDEPYSRTFQDGRSGFFSFVFGCFCSYLYQKRAKTSLWDHKWVLPSLSHDPQNLPPNWQIHLFIRGWASSLHFSALTSLRRSTSCGNSWNTGTVCNSVRSDDIIYIGYWIFPVGSFQTVFRFSVMCYRVILYRYTKMDIVSTPSEQLNQAVSQWIEIQMWNDLSFH